MEVVQSGHRPVGVALARKWHLPDAVVGIVANCTAYDEANRCSVVNCVRLANALAKEAGLYVGPLAAPSVIDVLRAGQVVLGLTDEDLNGIRTELADHSLGEAEHASSS
jgi:hypothetical protein